MPVVHLVEYCVFFTAAVWYRTLIVAVMLYCCSSGCNTAFTCCTEVTVICLQNCGVQTILNLLLIIVLQLKVYKHSHSSKSHYMLCCLSKVIIALLPRATLLQEKLLKLQHALLQKRQYIGVYFSCFTRSGSDNFWYPKVS
jgi:hypothetical protein